MKAEHRKELETNILADKVGKVLTNVKQGPSRGFLFYFVMSLIGCLGMFLIYRWWVTTTTRTGPMWVRFEDGTKQLIDSVIKDAPKENVGKAARLQVAYETLWIRGIKLLAGNRDRSPDDALLAIEAAAADYAALAEDCKGDPVFLPEALYGLAIVEETRAIKNRDYLVTAIDKYKAVVDANKDSAFATLAQQRIEELNDKDKKAAIERFYQELEVNLRRLELERGRGFNMIGPDGKMNEEALKKFLQKKGL